MTPKAFISHASEDKDRFVIEFAAKLRENGIDAWVDKWEMMPGDSLVNKIFDEGIKNADVIIIILSQNSVDKPWVKEEINAGFIKRIESNVKIIPVIIDDCNVPESLKSTLWEKINDLKSYNENLNRIVNSILKKSDKPPIGEKPKYTQTIIDIPHGLELIDTIIFNKSCEVALLKNDKLINLSEIYDYLKEIEIKDEDIKESLDILDSKGYIKTQKNIGGIILYFTISGYKFDTYLCENFDNYDLLVNEVCLKILNENLMTNYLIVENINVPILLINHILESLEQKNLIKINKALGGSYHITNISPELKRMFR